jgi:hypothetical protein
MSWNPAPTLGSASWQGNAPLVTKTQLLSTSAGLATQIVNSSTLTVSTLTVPDWISTAVLYVSDIQGASIDISGISITDQGIFNAPVVSLSSLNLKGFELGLNVSFDLGLGKAIGGVVGGLGALVGGGLIAVGTGAGLAIQGAEQGIATMVAGRPQNFISQTSYETINFTSQLQVSTLGNASPLYSSIFRTVSSLAPDQLPGREIFTSSFFSSGQICIRSVSDPFNLISGDSNLNTSTIQSFGQWVPLAGLEPENIVANGIVANTISTVDLFATDLQADAIKSYSVLASNYGVAQSLFMNYEAPLGFQTGATNSAAFIGNLNNLYCYNTTGYIFTSFAGFTQENASLVLGDNAFESVFNVSTVNALDGVYARNGNFSSLTVTSLTIVSTVNEVFSTTQVNLLSTAIVEADFVKANFASISSIAPFQFFSTTLGNSNGPFDITRSDSLFSTTYTSVSSLQQNILNYSFSIQNNTQANFNIGDNPGIGLVYKVTPANLTQWASTLLIFDGYQGPGAIDLGWVGQWGVTPGDTTGAAPGGATFDVQYTFQPAQGGAAPFYLTENSNNSYPFNTSTFFQYATLNPPWTGNFTARMTLPPVVSGSRSGWWQMTTPAPPPYSSSNNNTFQIYQDINDTYITASDRLHLQAGDIFLDGDLVLTAINAQTVNATTVNASNGFFQNFLSTATVQAAFLSTVTLNTRSNYSGALNGAPTLTPLLLGYSSVTSTDFTNIYLLTNPSRSPNYFNSLNVTQWNNSQFNATYGTTATEVPHVMVGDLFAFNPPVSYSGLFFINNTISSPPQPIPIRQNIAGYASTIGTVAGNTYARIRTTNGSNWAIDSNIANPQGGTFGPYAYQSQVITSVSENQVIQQTQQPTFVVAPSLQVNTNKILLTAPIIRTLTYGSPSWTTREAGIEFSSYFDSNVVFTGSQSDALNPILNPLGNLYYAFSAWSAQVWFGRIRTQSLGIQGFDVIGIATLYAGTNEYIWSSQRYLNVVDTAGLFADIREMYLMIPANYMTVTSFGGAW